MKHQDLETRGNDCFECYTNSPNQEQMKHIEKNMENYGFCLETVCNLISLNKKQFRHLKI